MSPQSSSCSHKHFVLPTLTHNLVTVTNGKLPHVYHFDSKALVEDYARSINLSATFFMPGFFMSNLPGGMFRQLPHLDNNWTLALPMPETAPIPLFDPEDTGKWIKAIVSQKLEDIVNKQVYAASSYVTPKEIVAAFQKQYPEAGKKASFVSVPHAQFQETLQSTGMPAFAAEELLENMRLMDEGGYFGGAGLEDSHKLLVEGDALMTRGGFMKKAPAFGAWSKGKPQTQSCEATLGEYKEAQNKDISGPALPARTE